MDPIQCPKCHAGMKENTLSTLRAGVTADKCSVCRGLWFDLGEAELLKEKWMFDHIDDGNSLLGKKHNKIRNINCPPCDKPMKQLSDPVEKHIQYEACTENGMYFDAGEFTDFKYETLMDIFRDFIFPVRKPT